MMQKETKSINHIYMARKTKMPHVITCVQSFGSTMRAYGQKDIEN